MALIIKNNKTLQDTVIVFFKNLKGKKEFQRQGDFSLIKINNYLVGLNVFNSSKYFKTEEGAHTLNMKQKDVLQKNNILFNDDFIFFEVGKVVERTNHPKSEKLFVLKVHTHKELQIVTNSKNSQVGKKVVVANVGAALPSGKIVYHSKVMGIESEGMLCGGETLGKDPTDGVLIVSGANGEEFIL